MKTAVLVLVLGLLGACSSTADRADREAPSSALPSPTPDAPGAPDPSGSAGNNSKGAVCDEVTAGIDAFNLGDYTGTVAHFRAALPLAEKHAARNDSTRADDLLDAVRYYAGLAPDKYGDAAASSPLFAKYKAITLGQCHPEPTFPQGPDGPPDNGGPTLSA